MPKRELPRSNSTRANALNRPKERLDQLPPPAEVPFTPNTLARLNVAQEDLQTKLRAVASALSGQTEATILVNETRKMAGYYIADFIEAMQRAVRREKFLPSARAYYQLPVGESHIPELRTETEVLEWGKKVLDGEADRVAAGGAPITFPDVAEVELIFNTFKNANIQQAERKTEYDNAQRAVAASLEEVDKLILRIWNEIETYFDEGDKPSMRRKAREWGVVYVPSKGEVPTPADFSLYGKVTLPDGTALAEVELSFSTGNMGVETTTDAEGNYYVGVVSAGTYQLRARKEGFEDVIIPDVVIEEGQLVELNIIMQPVAPEPVPTEPESNT